MTVTYTGNLKLALPLTGTESGTWGDIVNQQLTSLVDQSISGTVSLTSMTNADYTLTNGNGNAANEARYMALLVPASLTLTAARNIIVPSSSKMYIVKNGTAGGFPVTVKTAAGTGVVVQNGRTMLLYCDGTNVIVAFDAVDTAAQNGGQIAGFRNRVINGAMLIDQRNSGASVTPTVGAFTLDKWVAELSQPSKYSAQQTATVPAGFSKSFLATSLSAYAVSALDAFGLGTRIEGFNVADFAWGSVSAQPVTLSFWVRSSLTGTFGGSFRNATLNRSYPFSYTVTAANTWEKKSVSVVGDTVGSWRTDSTVGINLVFGIGVGTTYSATAGAWATGNYISATGATSVVGTNGATFYITGVQLELGTAASTFEQRTYGAELALCQRYYEAIAFPAVSTGPTSFGYFKVTKRATPTLTYISGATGAALQAINLDCVSQGAFVSVSGTTLWAATADI